jgi:hypothetical protein
VTTKLDYMLTGCANGHSVRIQGTGSVTGRRLRFAVWPIEVPLDLDPAVALFAGVDALLAVAAGLVKLPKEPLVARSRADFLGEGGVEVGTIVALATVERRAGRIRCRAQIADARVAMEVGEQLVAVEERAITMAHQPDGVAFLSATMVSTARGREWSVLSSTKVVGGEAADLCAVTMPMFRITRTRDVARIALDLPARTHTA